MYRIAILINIAFFITAGNCQGTDLPATTGQEKIFESNVVAERTCRIPPYPERGSYVVVNEPNARPGDSFQNLTLIQYSTDERSRLVEVNAFACSLGEWYLKALRYEVENAFDASSCPLLCANSSDAQTSAQRRIPSRVTQTVVQPPNLCKLPPYPPNGWYEVVNSPQTKPGEVLKAAYLLYRCNLRYKAMGSPNVACFDGTWYSAAPKCIEESLPAVSENSTLYTTRCKLPEYPNDGEYIVLNIPEAIPGETYETANLEYSCKGDSRIVGKKRVYCINGVWSSELPKCVRCGFITNTGAVNVSSSLLPWHVGVYDKSSTHSHICGGSIVATNLVVSAASCFWTQAEGILPATRFAVAAGKLYRDWDDSRDAYAQNSDVNKIVVPSRFRGALTNFQNDIALLFLTTPLTYSDYVAPICIDFDTAFEESQLKQDNVGKLGVWGGTDESTEESSALQIKNLAYVDINKCITDASPEFLAYITSDKICAAVSNDTEVCESYRGEGLVFPAMDEGNAFVNYYLRGVVPASSKGDEVCTKPSVTTFTQITTYETFFKPHFESAIW